MAEWEELLRNTIGMATTAVGTATEDLRSVVNEVSSAVQSISRGSIALELREKSPVSPSELALLNTRLPIAVVYRLLLVRQGEVKSTIADFYIAIAGYPILLRLFDTAPASVYIGSLELPNKDALADMFKKLLSDANSILVVRLIEALR